MKKACIIFLCLGIIVAGVLFSGCTAKNNRHTINYQRRLQNYLPADTTGASGTIDLSDGTKTKYDANLGPQELNFDIKIQNPYKY